MSFIPVAPAALSPPCCSHHFSSVFLAADPATSPVYVAADCASSPTAGRQPSQAHKAHLMTASRTLSLFCSQQTTRARPLQSSSSHRAFTQTWMCTATSVLTSYRTSGLRSMMYVPPLCLFAPSSESPTTTALSTRLLRPSGARYESMRLTCRMWVAKC